MIISVFTFNKTAPQTNTQSKARLVTKQSKAYPLLKKRKEKNLYPEK